MSISVSSETVVNLLQTYPIDAGCQTLFDTAPREPFIKYEASALAQLEDDRVELG